MQRLVLVLVAVMLLFTLGCGGEEEPKQEGQEVQEEVYEEASDDYVDFLVDHTARVFEAAELQGQEEIDALQVLAEEYLNRDHDVPGELEKVHALYSEAMEFYAEGVQDNERGMEAFMKISAAVEELDKHVDLDDYE